MILPVSSNTQHNQMFSAGSPEENNKKYTHDTLLPNNFATRFRIGMDKFTNAITLYPSKGLNGNRNANFYEFLTMGQVPYLIGSGTLMAVFNVANKYFAPFAELKAAPLGKKMALGVIFYGIAKELSKPLITKPVKWLTGVDTEVPYAKVNYELPDDVYDTDITSIEYHKVFESVEFPRWDLLYKPASSKKPRNAYYDKVARKLGLGSNLKDSDQEVKPRIKEIVVKSKVAQNISSYLWAATGVALAFENGWLSFIDGTLSKKSKLKNLGKIFNDFGWAAERSMKSFYRGIGKSGLSKHAGKALIFTSLGSSVLGVLNVMSSSQKPSKLDSADIIEKDRKYVVN